MKTSLLVTLALSLTVAASVPCAAQTLRTDPLHDKTGTIGLAPGWKQINAYRGAVDCSGPNGASIRLGLPFAILVPIDPVTGWRPIGADTAPVANTGDLVGALREVMTKSFQARITKLTKRQAKSASPGVPAYYFCYDFVQGGKTFTVLGYFTTLSYGSTSPVWSLYSSGVIAPKPVFKKMLPTMLKMWASWRPNGQEPDSGSASALVDGIIKQRWTSAHKQSDDFLEHVLGGTPKRTR
jgi:hypothetical protein